MKNTNNITFVIHPTEYCDYDILAIGSWQLLAELSHEDKHYDLIPKSKFGRIPILVMDTRDTLRDALSCIKKYRKVYKN